LREGCSARAGVSGAAATRTAPVRANAVILVAKSALSVCSVSATDGRGSAARGGGFQRIRIRTAWMAMIAHSGDRSSPATAGISRRIGRSTGSLNVVSTDCSGE
jgi:hypothetical protein